MRSTVYTIDVPSIMDDLNDIIDGDEKLYSIIHYLTLDDYLYFYSRLIEIGNGIALGHFDDKINETLIRETFNYGLSGLITPRTIGPITLLLDDYLKEIFNEIYSAGLINTEFECIDYDKVNSILYIAVVTR